MEQMLPAANTNLFNTLFPKAHYLPLSQNKSQLKPVCGIIFCTLGTNGLRLVKPFSVVLYLCHLHFA